MHPRTQSTAQTFFKSINEHPKTDPTQQHPSHPIHVKRAGEPLEAERQRPTKRFKG